MFREAPNGMAQRQRRDWRDALPIMAYSGKSRLRGAAEPLSDWSRCWAAFHVKVNLPMVTSLFF